MRRITIRTGETSIEVDVEANELESILKTVLQAGSGTSSTEGKAAHEKKDLATKKTKKRRASGGRQRGIREYVLQDILRKDMGEAKAYVDALKSRGSVTDAAMVALYLAQQAVNKGLTSGEISRLLEELFSIGLDEHAIRMAVIKSRTRKKPLVAMTRTDAGAINQLTPDGRNYVSSLLKLPGDN